MSERARVRLNRAGVVTFGLLSYGLALGADTVWGLVEEASAFGSAGVFVVVPFALFSRFGGASAAITSLVAGAVSYVGGAHLWGWDYPYLTSVGFALTAYAVVAWLAREPLMEAAG
jgi:Na+/proline symporter